MEFQFLIGTVLCAKGKRPKLGKAMSKKVSIPYRYCITFFAVPIDFLVGRWF